MRRIVYIINPISGTGVSPKLQQLIATKTTEAGIPFRIFYSVANGDYSFLHPVIREEKITDVVIAGGDGTVSQVINSLMNCNINFGIIPVGSGNGLAYTAKIPGQPRKALENIFNGKPVALDGFCVNGHFACMLCGLGFDAMVAHDFARQSGRGLVTYVKQILKNFIHAKTWDFEITLRQSSFSTKAFFISIANTNQYGNHFTIAPAASLNDGLLDVVIISKQNKLNWILHTLRQISKKNKPVTETNINPEKAIIYFQTDRLHVKNLSQAPLHIDGEPAETPAEITVQVKKRCFRLLQPAC